MKKDKPKAPMVPRYLYGDATTEALIQCLSKFPIGAIVSSEGGTVLGSHSMKPEQAMKNCATLNVLWDAGRITTDRISGGNTQVTDARFSVSIMTQESVLVEFNERPGGVGQRHRVIRTLPYVLAGINTRIPTIHRSS